MRLLVVEDDVKMAALVRRGLIEEGAAVDVARKGEDALWMVQSAPYDAVVLDVMLPGLSGLEVCRALRVDHPGLPIVMLSALGDEDRSFKSDAAHLLLDQARIFDGEQPENAKGFGERMARVLRAGVANRKPASAA